MLLLLGGVRTRLKLATSPIFVRANVRLLSYDNTRWKDKFTGTFGSVPCSRIPLAFQMQNTPPWCCWIPSEQHRLQQVTALNQEQTLKSQGRPSRDGRNIPSHKVTEGDIYTLGFLVWLCSRVKAVTIKMLHFYSTNLVSCLVTTPQQSLYLISRSNNIQANLTQSVLWNQFWFHYKENPTKIYFSLQQLKDCCVLPPFVQLRHDSRCFLSDNKDKLSQEIHLHAPFWASHEVKTIQPACSEVTLPSFQVQKSCFSLGNQQSINYLNSDA